MVFPTWCLLALQVLLLHSYCSNAQDPIIRTPDMIPAAEVRSMNPVAPPFAHRYNIERGAYFRIVCYASHASTSDYTLEFYKDGRVIGDGDLPDTVLTPADPQSRQKEISLNFTNFQPEHNGVYYCNATLSSGLLPFILDEAADLYLYGTSEPSVIQSHITGVVFLPEEEDLVLDADFRGDYVQSDWVYSADDPSFASFERLSTFESSGVTISNLNQRYTVASQTAAHRFGYYAPAIVAEVGSEPSVELDFVVNVLLDDDASPSVSLPASVEAQEHGSLNIICEGSAFLEVFIEFTVTGVSASHTAGETVLVSEATGTTSHVARRTITLQALSTLDCGGTVTCTVSSVSGGTTYTSNATATLQVLAAPMLLSVAPNDPVLSEGEPISLVCQAANACPHSLTWLFDGMPVGSSARVAVTGNHTSTMLKIAAVAKSDFGTYTCVIENSAGNDSQVVHVRETGSLTLVTDFTSPPSIALHSSLTAMDGDGNRFNIQPNASFSIECVVESPGEFSLHANVNGRPLSTGNGTSVSVAMSTPVGPARVQKTLSITFSSFSPAMNGVYGCTADSALTRVTSRKIFLSTGEAILNPVSPQYVVLSPPSALELAVTASGAFETLTWYYNGAESDHFSLSNFGQVLNVDSAVVDAGEYVARLQGTYQLEVAFQVQPFSAPAFNLTAPTFIITPEPLIVSCRVASFPQSVVTVKVGQTERITTPQVDFDETNSMVIHTTGDVKFTAEEYGSSADVGVLCTAAIDRNGSIEVHSSSPEATVMIYAPPSVSLLVTKSPASVGDNITITCAASGGIPSDYSFMWFKGSAMHPLADVVVDETMSQLALSDIQPDDFDTYTCRVNNSVAQTQKSISLTEAALPVPFINPNPPSPVLFDGMVKLTCSSHGLGPFNFTWMKGGESLESVRHGYTLVLVVNITSLDDYTDYTCAVQNGEGESSASVTVQQEPTVAPTVVPVTPAMRNVFVGSNFTLTVNITSYNVRPTVEWALNGAPISEGEKYSVMTDVDMLGSGVSRLTTLEAELASDIMMFTANVSNIHAGGGFSVGEFEVYIEALPVPFINPNPPSPVLFGGMVNLTCSSRGLGPFTFTWMKGGESLESVSHDYTLVLVVNITSLDDYTDYTCAVQNGAVTSLASVTVQQEPTVAPTVVPVTPAVRSVLVGSNFTLSMNITSYNVRPTVEWALNGAPISEGGKYSVMTDVDMLGSGVSRLTTLEAELASDIKRFTANVSNLHAGGGFSVGEFEVHIEDGDRCDGESDEWGILWTVTAVDGTDVQNCVAGDNNAGRASRVCVAADTWGEPDVSECEELKGLQESIEMLLASLPDGSGTEKLGINESVVDMIRSVSSVLKDTTNPESRTRPLFPRDLNTTNNFLDLVSQYAERTLVIASLQENGTDTLLIISDNILDMSYFGGWRTLDDDSYTGGSPLLLGSVERISAALTDTLDGKEKVERNFTGSHIVVKAVQNLVGGDASSTEAVEYPLGEDQETLLRAFGRNSSLPVVTIPEDVLKERAQSHGAVGVVTAVFDNLGRILPRNCSSCRSRSSDIDSPVISVQVVGSSVKGSTFASAAPVSIDFNTSQTLGSCSVPECVFWDFSNNSTTSAERKEHSGWSSENLTTVAGKGRDVRCQSTHLTSFAMLVDYGGVVHPEPGDLFSILTYIGCGISIICLSISIVFFIAMFKFEKKNVVNFVHLNFCFALFCGLVIFVGAIWQAGLSEVACTIVAVLLHYFFLSVFCWMLCEGLMMYMLLVRVFGAHAMKWRLIYCLIGWGSPVLIVLPTLVAVLVSEERNYFIVSRPTAAANCNRYCWLPTDYGLVWAFFAPAIAISLFNVIFMAVAVRSVYKAKKQQLKRTSDEAQNYKLATNVLKSVLVLLPLLGLTWLFGLLAANPWNTATATAFQWLFVIFNSLQGFAVFVFHVVRHEKVWRKITGLCSKPTRALRLKLVTSSRSTNRGLVDASRCSIPGSVENLIENSNPFPEKTLLEEMMQDDFVAFNETAFRRLIAGDGKDAYSSECSRKSDESSSDEDESSRGTSQRHSSVDAQLGDSGSHEDEFEDGEEKEKLTKNDDKEGEEEEEEEEEEEKEEEEETDGESEVTDDDSEEDSNSEETCSEEEGNGK